MSKIILGRKIDRKHHISVSVTSTRAFHRYPLSKRELVNISVDLI